MKHFLSFALCLLLACSMHAQSPYLKINAAPPTQLKQGQSFKLITSVAHNFPEEKLKQILMPSLDDQIREPLSFQKQAAIH